MIGGFGSVLCVSVFQGSLLVIVIMIDASEKRNCEGGFLILEFACCEKRSKKITELLAIRGHIPRGVQFKEVPLFIKNFFWIINLSAVLVNQR